MIISFLTRLWGSLLINNQSTNIYKMQFDSTDRSIWIPTCLINQNSVKLLSILKARFSIAVFSPMIETSSAHSKKRRESNLLNQNEGKRGRPGHEGLVNMGKDWVCIPNAMGNHCRALLWWMTRLDLPIKEGTSGLHIKYVFCEDKNWTRETC